MDANQPVHFIGPNDPCPCCGDAELQVYDESDNADADADSLVANAELQNVDRANEEDDDQRHDQRQEDVEEEYRPRAPTPYPVDEELAALFRRLTTEHDTEGEEDAMVYRYDMNTARCAGPPKLPTLFVQNVPVARESDDDKDSCMPSDTIMPPDGTVMHYDESVEVMPPQEMMEAIQRAVRVMHTGFAYRLNNTPTQRVVITELNAQGEGAEQGQDQAETPAEPAWMQTQRLLKVLKYDDFCDTYAEAMRKLDQFGAVQVNYPLWTIPLRRGHLPMFCALMMKTCQLHAPEGSDNQAAAYLPVFKIITAGVSLVADHDESIFDCRYNPNDATLIEIVTAWTGKRPGRIMMPETGDVV